MLVLEAKLRGQKQQFAELDEAIRTANFVRNKALRFWQDNKGVGKKELSALCAVLAKEFEWAKKLNSMARQASAERAWFSISRFYANCKSAKAGKKGFPRFKKRGHSVDIKPQAGNSQMIEKLSHSLMVLRLENSSSKVLEI